MAELTHLDDIETTPHAEVFDKQRPRTVRLSLEAGEQIPAHRHPESDIVLHLLSGQLILRLDDQQYNVYPNDVVQFNGKREISPKACEDSVALIVFASHENPE